MLLASNVIKNWKYAFYAQFRDTFYCKISN